MFLKNVNLAIRFILELCVLASFGYWGFKTQKILMMKMILGIGAPILIAVIWAMFGAPQAAYELSIPLQWLLSSLIYLLAFSALYVSGKSKLAVLFAIIAIVNSVLMYIWKQ